MEPSVNRLVVNPRQDLKGSNLVWCKTKVWIVPDVALEDCRSSSVYVILFRMNKAATRHADNCRSQALATFKWNHICWLVLVPLGPNEAVMFMAIRPTGVRTDYVSRWDGYLSIGLIRSQIALLLSTSRDLRYMQRLQ